MSTTQSTSQPPHPPQQKDHLTILEEDDEFEEFPVADWDDSDSTPPRLWEDNWDDDDVEEEFSMQLRGELAKCELTKNEKIPPVDVDAMQT